MQKNKHLFYILLITFLVITIFIYKKNNIDNFSDCNKCKISDPDLYLINVLDEEEFNDAHIKGSIHVPFEKIENFLSKIKNKETKLIFYCANYLCTSSDESAIIANKKGFKNIFVYKGGMAEWYQLDKKYGNFDYIGKATAGYLQMRTLKKSHATAPLDLNIVSNDQSKKPFNEIDSLDLQKILKQGNLL
jgi:rhodanese-related sulfurtransferase